MTIISKKVKVGEVKTRKARCIIRQSGKGKLLKAKE